MVSDSYRSKYNFELSSLKLPPPSFSTLQICTPHCWLKPPGGKSSQTASLVGNGHVLFPWRTWWSQPWGLTHITHWALANTQFPMPGAYKPFPFLPLPPVPTLQSVRGVLPSDLKVTHLNYFSLLSSLHYQKALSTPFILLWGLLLLSRLLQSQDLDHLTSSLFTQSTYFQHVFIHIYFLF